MSESTTAQSTNARRLVRDLHKLSDLLVTRAFSGQSYTVVPAPNDNGEHRKAERLLVNLCDRLAPTASQKEIWSETFTRIQIPAKQGTPDTRPLALDDFVGWTSITVSYDASDPRRGMTTSSSPTVAYLPMGAIADAHGQLWTVLDEIDLGIPSNSRPYGDYS